MDSSGSAVHNILCGNTPVMLCCMPERCWLPASMLLTWTRAILTRFIVVSLCCIPAVSRWRTYRRCCSRVRAELELWLRSGGEGLLALTVTAGSDSNSSYQVYRVYWQQVTNVQEGRELRRLVIYPGEDLVVLTAGRLVKNWPVLC